MIRLRPTTLAMGRSDLKDYEVRRQPQRILGSSDHFLNKSELWVSLGRPAAGFDVIDNATSREDALSSTGGSHELGIDCDGRTLAIQTFSVPDSCKLTDKCNTCIRESAIVGIGDTSDEASLPEGDLNLVSIGMARSVEKTTADLQDPQFHQTDSNYIEPVFQHPADQTVSLTWSSTPYSPQETPTLPNLQSSESMRPRLRKPIPRSPLFIAHNASTSPEHRQTSSLTPRVTSRVATHHTPGIIFSQPPRRLAQRPRREFRHQANSFSFDSSERSSAAYGHERISSSSTTESARRISVDLSLHEELQAVVLQEPSTPSKSSSSTEIAETKLSLPPCQCEPVTVTDLGEVASVFSPSLVLPAPFSVRSRGPSNAESLPSSTVNTRQEYLPHDDQKSSSSPEIPPRDFLDRASPDHFDMDPNSRLSSRSASTSYSPVNLFRLAGRVLSACKARTASTARSPSNNSVASVSPTSRQVHPGQNLGAINIQTPARNYHVYNDAVSPDSQPQTPAELPESRHQSRFHGSYTAPVSRVVASSNFTSVNNREETPRQLHQASWMTPSRMPGRTSSPIGLSTPGFRGLYGGRENGDEEGNWAEGIRFTNTTSRVVDLGGARRTERDMRQPPEADYWRVGGR